MNNSFSFTNTILNVFFERICKPINFLSIKLNSSTPLWDEPIKMYEKIEKYQLEVDSVIVEAKKYSAYFNGERTPRLYHALLCRVYILVYYKHRDDPLYQEIVVPRLRDNMGIYSSQHLKTINEEIDKILRQEEMIKKANQEKMAKETEQTFTKTEVEQMMQSQSNNVVQLENELREAQKSISELEVGSQERNSLSASDQAKIAELTNENEELKNKFANQNDVVKLESEISRLVKEHEDMIVELLKPIFYGNEKDICEFLKIIEGRKDSEITDVVYDWVDAKKISEKSKGRSLWTILHAAKMYQATEQNWNTALRNHPSNKR